MEKPSKIILTLFLIIGFLYILSFPVGYTFTSEWTKPLIVTGKETKLDPGGKSQTYLIFTEHETFSNMDSLWFWKFNSSDVYGKIITGEEYKFRVNWIRIPFLSMYRNIIDVEKIE